MLAASRAVQAVGEAAEGETVSLFEACIEVLGFARQGDYKSASEFVRMVQLAAASVPPPEPFPQFPSREEIEAVMTHGSDDEFETLLASQQAFFKRLVAEYSDGQLGREFGRLVRATRQRSS